MSLMEDEKKKLYEQILGKYSDPNRDAIIQNQPNGINALRSITSAIGAGFGGRDPVAAANSVWSDAEKSQASQLADFDKQRANQIQNYSLDRTIGKDIQEDEAAAMAKDPNSRASIVRRYLLKKNNYNEPDLETLSAADIDPILSGYEKLNALEQKKIKDAEEMQYKKQVLGQKSVGVGGKTLTPGQKALDTAYGKEFNEWTSSGKAELDKNLSLLEDAKKTLLKRSKDLIGTSGRFSGRLPEWAKSDEAISLRDLVRRAVQGSMKASLGPAFTEKEGERVMMQSYNENLPPLENLKKVQTTIDNIKSLAAAQESKAREFSETGSLSKWNPSAQPMPTPGPSSSGKIKISNGAESLEIDASDLEDAMKDGFKRIE